MSLALGRALEEMGHTAEAAGLYQQIIQRDDRQEEAHRRLMACWARSGDRARALQHYERVTKLLHSVLMAEPEPETSELYDRIRSAQPV